MRVIVCGGRRYAARSHLRAALDRIHADTPISLLIHGCAAGADGLADEWAFDRGVPIKKFAADWRAHGHAAGPKRNRRMLEEGKAEAVIAFDGGRGTANMCWLAERAGVPVHRVPGP